MPYTGFTGTVAQALRPYPQYQTITAQNGRNGSSSYHSMQAKLEKRFSDGLQFRVAYTLSKLINNGAESGQSESEAPPQSVYLRDKALSLDNVANAVVIAFTYELPFGKGKRTLNTNGVANYIVGGWNLSGVHRYSSGRPFAMSMNNLYSGVLFNTGMRPDRVAGSGGYQNNNNSQFDIAKDRYLTASRLGSPSGWPTWQ